MLLQRGQPNAASLLAGRRMAGSSPKMIRLLSHAVMFHSATASHKHMQQALGKSACPPALIPSKYSSHTFRRQRLTARMLISPLLPPWPVSPLYSFAFSRPPPKPPKSLLFSRHRPRLHRKPACWSGNEVCIALHNLMEFFRNTTAHYCC